MRSHDFRGRGDRIGSKERCVIILWGRYFGGYPLAKWARGPFFGMPYGRVLAKPITVTINAPLKSDDPTSLDIGLELQSPLFFLG